MSKYKPDDIITPVEASKESEIAYLTISRAIKAGKIPSKKEKNIISLVFKDFEKWWREYQNEQNLIAERINKSRELLEKLSGKKESFEYGSVIPPTYSLKIKYHDLKESDFDLKDIGYICKSAILKPNQIYNIELLSLYSAFRPSKLTIRTTEIESNIETFCEICNVTVMGEPQIISFNGVTDNSQRGNSLIFSNELDISNWSLFGGSAGQGLILDISNPHEKEVRIEILITGWNAKSSNLGEKVYTNNNKLLFSKIKCKPNNITKLKILAGRGSAFTPNFIQMNHSEKGILEIIDISVLKRQQIDFLTENSSLSTNYFSKLRPVKFDIFGSSENRGLEITFKNNNSHDIVNYITLLGENTNDDLVGKK